MSSASVRVGLAEIASAANAANAHGAALSRASGVDASNDAAPAQNNATYRNPRRMILSMSDDSNLDQVMSQLKQFIGSFDFTRPGIEGSMGKDAAHAVAERIAEAAADQKTTDDEPFPANAPEYAAWKDKRYGVGNPAYGRRTGQMLSLESLLGEVEVNGDEVTIRYGTGRPPERSSASSYISESDKSITDIEKAFFITNQGGKRVTFYKAGKSGREAVVEVIKEAVARAIQEENGG